MLPPEGIHPNAGNQLADLRPPPGVTRAQLARGEQIFQGQADSATCAGCHGMDGKGTPMGADLTSTNTSGAMAACSPSITSS